MGIIDWHHVESYYLVDRELNKCLLVCHHQPSLCIIFVLESAMPIPKCVPRMESVWESINASAMYHGVVQIAISLLVLMLCHIIPQFVVEEVHVLVRIRVIVRKDMRVFYVSIHFAVESDQTTKLYAQAVVSVFLMISVVVMVRIWVLIVRSGRVMILFEPILEFAVDEGIVLHQMSANAVG